MSGHSDAHGHGGESGFHAPHVAPAKLFINVLLALLVLTILTVAVSRFDFGSFNMLVAMLIAAVKAALVMTFFMHLKWDTAINNIAILSSFMFLALLFVFTLADLSTRDATDRANVEVPDNRESLLRAREAKLGSPGSH